MWADAICINQNDTQERSQQVQRICDIYRQGYVCIYLNTPDRDAYKAVRATITQIRDNPADGSPVHISKETWVDMAKFFSRAWFHRMWMIQEFVMARSTPLMLFLGGHKVVNDWELRDAAWEFFQHYPSHLTIQERDDLLSGIKQYMSMADIKDRIMKGRPCSFFTLLWVFRDRLVTDPKDKVYSLHGLLQEENVDGDNDAPAVPPQTRGLATQELRIDYDAEVEDVYASLVKAVVIGMDSLNIICACQRPGNFVRSWVPNWAEPWSRRGLLANSIDIATADLSENRFHASGTRAPTIEFSKTLAHITVAGVYCSTVSALGTRPSGQLDSSWAIKWFRNVDSKLKLEVEVLYGEEPEGAFNISICAANTSDDGFKCAEALADDYFLYFSGASVEWKEMVRKYREGDPDEIDPESFIMDIRIAQMVDGRKVFVGVNGYCGLVPDHAEKGDLICVLFGCDVPVVLRKVEGHFIFIGECYAQGLMQGESIEALERGELRVKQFNIF